MTLNEKDERRSYLNYLTNLYSKKNIMIEVDNKPEYTGGSDDLLEQRMVECRNTFVNDLLMFR